MQGRDEYDDSVLNIPSKLEYSKRFKNAIHGDREIDRKQNCNPKPVYSEVSPLNTNK